jgi:hypothetical protein
MSCVHCIDRWFYALRLRLCQKVIFNHPSNMMKSSIFVRESNLLLIPVDPVTSQLLCFFFIDMVEERNIC